ncbi:LamG domain-containing protein [Streptomyces polygonati]|uniref:LamG domain-containing protein n=1 Tax=Streptomyces polygonati TaxID=1617087 RepID=A0ABV8HVK1_9ACTN
MSARSKRRRHRGRRTTGALLALALAGATLVGLAGPAQADGGSDPGQGDGHVTALPADAGPADRAMARAESSGQPVVVDALTTPYAQTTAMPDGTLSQTSTVSPTRVQLNGTWVPVDAGLKTDTDGTLSARAPLNPLTLSGGGDTALATLSSPTGKSLSVTMPFPLPVPSITGDTAHYADVLPDVDLDVTATELGGIREVLIVKTATAATNPALATLRLGTSGAGLTMQADSSGSLQAVDSSGATVFVAPAPTMWDSSTTAGATALNSGRTARSLTAAPDDSGTDPSTAEGPGAGAQSAPVPVTVSGNSVSLTPVADVLHGTGTHYPVFIDPSFIAWQAGDPTWTWVQSAHTTTDNFGVYGTSQSSQPGLGLCGTYPDGGSCSPSDKERTYYQFSISRLATLSDYIASATLKVTQTYSADWSCTNAYAVRAFYTPTQIGHGTNWDTQPGGGAMQPDNSDNVGGTGSTGCSGNVDFAYNADTSVTTVLNSSTPNTITFGLYGDESNANGFKRLSNKASLTVNYDHTPDVPVTMAASPNPQYVSAGTTQPCSTSTNPANAFLGNPGLAPGLQLKAIVASPISQPVRGYFDLWDGSADGAPTIDSGYSSGYISPPSNTAVYQVPTSELTDGHVYGWDAAADDGILTSGPSQHCYFRVDLSPPTVSMPTAPTLIDAGSLAYTFPPAGNGQTTGLHTGQQGYIPFTAADPSNHGPNSGLACLRWSFDPTLADAGWQCGTHLPTSTGLFATPVHWGTNILYAQAEDNAGNYSGVASYAFYVPWNPNGPKPVFGDTTGDGSPDIVVPGSDGNLYAHSVPGNTQATSPAVSLAAKVPDSPSGDTWKNYQVTHRGSMRLDSHLDDLIAHKSGSTQLYFYNNPGNTGADGRFDASSTVGRPACTTCTGYAADWSKTLQIAALGDPSTTQLTVNGLFDSYTGLLTTESNSSGDAGLWFYPTVSYGAFGQPVCLATTGWKNFDLISPGDTSGSGKPGMWARDRTTGDITAYTFTTGTLTPPPDEFGDPVPSVPTVTAISSGTKIGNVSAATDPGIGSDSDLTGDGISDLWTITTAGTLTVRPGKTVGGTPTTAVNGFDAAFVAGNTTSAADQWPLKGNGSDTDAQNPATAHGNTGWGTDHAGTASGAATFTGTTGYLQTSRAALDATKSYTVSAWVKLNSLTTTQIAVGQGTVNHQAFYLGYHADLHSWVFMTTTSDTPTTNFCAASGGTPTIGTWTHLTAVYNADSNIMSLYVNGALTTDAALNTTPVYNSSAPLTIGATLTLGSTTPTNQLNGSVADVRAFPAALTNGEVSSLYTTS